MYIYSIYTVLVKSLDTFYWENVSKLLTCTVYYIIFTVFTIHKIYTYIIIICCFYVWNVSRSTQYALTLLSPLRIVLFVIIIIYMYFVPGKPFLQK